MLKKSIQQIVASLIVGGLGIFTTTPITVIYVREHSLLLITAT